MSRYVEVPADALRAALTEAGFTPDPRAHGDEEVYLRRHHRDNRYAVKVYSTIPRAGAAARGCGADAIRVVAVVSYSWNNTRGVYKGPRVYRTGSVEAVIERMLQRMREAYGFINEKLRKERQP